MEFRFRALVSAHVDLPQNRLVTAWSVRFTKVGLQSDGALDYLADFLIDEVSAADAFRVGYSKAKRMADVLAYKSLSPLRLHPLSATVGRVKIGETFPIAVLQQSVNWSPAMLDDTALGDVPSQIGLEVMDLMSAFRSALSNDDQLASFVRCWAAFEPELKRVACLQNQLTPRVLCPKCKVPIGGELPATQIVLQGLINEVSDASSYTQRDFSAKRLRMIRGKIAHGADLGDAEFRKEFDGALPTLLSAIATHVWKSSSVRTAFQYRPVVFPEITQFSMVFTEAARAGIDWSSAAEVRASIAQIAVPSAATFSQESRFRIGLFEMPEYNAAFLPEVEA